MVLIVNGGLVEQVGDNLYIRRLGLPTECVYLAMAKVTLQEEDRDGPSLVITEPHRVLTILGCGPGAAEFVAGLPCPECRMSGAHKMDCSRRR